MIDPEEMTDAEFDGACITEWLEYLSFHPLVPPAADGVFPWAHENPAAWEHVKFPAGMTQTEAYQLMAAAAKAETAQSAAAEGHPSPVR